MTAFGLSRKSFGTPKSFFRNDNYNRIIIIIQKSLKRTMCKTFSNGQCGSMLAKEHTH